MRSREEGNAKNFHGMGLKGGGCYGYFVEPHNSFNGN